MKPIRVIMLSALCGVMSLGSSHASPPVTGTITVPTVSPSPESDVSLHARCAYLLGGAASQGMFGYVVPLTPDEADGNHTFSLVQTDPTPAGGDVDVIFFETMGNCAGGSTVSGVFENDGGEIGDVPPDSTRALILSRGAPNVSFRFEISPA